VARVPAVYLFSNRIIIFKRKAVRGLLVGSAPPLSEYWSVYKQ
jgi:peptide/nickel transport system substrate-binding protein